MSSGDGNRMTGALKRVGLAVLAIGLAPIALLALLFLGVRELVARIRGDFRPVIPASSLDDSDFDDAQAAARAFVNTLKLAVPDAVETLPDPNYWPPGEHDDMTLPHAIALRSPRLTDEQVLVGWDAPEGDLVRVEFPPLRAPIGAHDWYVGDSVSEVYWIANGLLTHGVRYAPNKVGQARAWIHVPDAGGWTTLGAKVLVQRLREYEVRRPLDRARTADGGGRSDGSEAAGPRGNRSLAFRDDGWWRCLLPRSSRRLRRVV